MVLRWTLGLQNSKCLFQFWFPHNPFWICFVYGVRKCSSFILLQVVDQFSQHHLLKRSSFLHCIFWPPLSKIRCPQVCGFISIYFYFVSLICISVFVPVPYCLDDCGFVVEPEVRQVDSSSAIILSQDFFGYSRFFSISIQIMKLFVLVLWKIWLVAW